MHWGWPTGEWRGQSGGWRGQPVWFLGCLSPAGGKARAPCDTSPPVKRKVLSHARMHACVRSQAPGFLSCPSASGLLFSIH